MNETELERFVEAQNFPGGGYEQAFREIRNGRKRSHWVWYILAQLRGLGYSNNAYFYGIATFYGNNRCRHTQTLLDEGA